MNKAVSGVVATPVRAKKVVQGARARLFALFLALTPPRFSLKDQIYFAKRLSFLLNAGVSVIEALHLLREQAHGGGQIRLLDQIILDVSNGKALSQSFMKFPKVFSEFMIHIIKIGEASGTLSANLTYLADELKKEQALRRKVVGAFVYPAIITLATLGITIFLVVYLFPKIMPVFMSLNVTLPFTTRAVIFLSEFLRHFWLFLFLGIGACVVLCTLALRKSRKFRILFHYVLLRLPIAGKILKYYIVANGTRTLGLLLKSGISLSESLSITADTTSNLVYKYQFRVLGKIVTRGDKMSTYCARETFFFPAMLGHMVAVGERSGKLSETLIYLSELYEAEVDEFTKNISTMIEPLLMVIMGVMVGFIAISIITPIYSITQNLHV